MRKRARHMADHITRTTDNLPERQELPLPATAELAAGWVAEGQLLGAQVFVARGEDVVGHLAIGSSEPGRPAATSDVARLYCSAKPLTTICLAQAVERGLLDWDDPISRFLPVIDTPRHRSLTLRSLLTHSSGLPLSGDNCYRVEFGETVRMATADDIP